MKKTITIIHKNGMLLLGLFTLLTIAGIVRYHNVPWLQFQLVAGLVVLYLGWSFVHHHKDKSLTLEVALEYILTALLAIVIIYGLIL